MDLNARVSILAERSEDPDLIRKAWSLAEQSHRGQLRASGEPFVSHPLAVAEILLEEGLAPATLAAALLHDTLEDTDLTLSELSSRMGEEIAQLVDGVTKIQKVAPRGSKARSQHETYRKMIIASVDDARVLVLKLADRLHNMRTIDALSYSRQEAISGETIDVYAPLAMRLGMSRFREELEDRAFAVIDPPAYREAGLLRNEQGRVRSDQLDRMISTIQDGLAEQGVSAVMSTRVKSHFSVAQKLKRANGEIYDILGIRLIVNRLSDCYLALGVIHGIYTPRFDRLRDYIARPKANGYQSLHTTVIGLGGSPVEIQIRTQEMHQSAEHGLAAHWLYKEELSDGGPPQTRAWIGQLAEHVSLDPDQMLQAMRSEVFREEIWVFTPKGEIQVLPKGATPVDFAYAVHTELGHSCSGAKINGVLAGTEAVLSSGDVVEIIRGSVKPRRRWLSSVVSPRARSRIRAYWAAQEKPELARQGQSVLEDELRSAGLRPLTEPVLLQDMLRKLGYIDPGRAFAEAARPGRAHQIVERIAKKLATQGPPAEPGWQTAPDFGITVAGMSDLWVKPAGCCKPLPGQPVKARVALGGGVVVHNADCSQLVARSPSEKVRILPASWIDPVQSAALTTGIELVCRDRTGLMSAISDSVYGAGLDLQDVVLHSRRGLVRGTLTVRLVHVAQQELLIDSLLSVDGVLSAVAERQES